MNAILIEPEAVCLPMPRCVRQNWERARREPVRPTAERIVLTGFMGSGKSTVGRLLASELGWEFVDLDSVIEQRTEMTVPQIFAEQGEAAFRKEETAALAVSLRRTHLVIALGGGAPETLANRLLLEQTPATLVVLLGAPFAILTERCALQAQNPSLPSRPVLVDLDSAKARFAARLPLYQRLAHVAVDTTTQLPAETTAAVLEAIAEAAR